jgi:hypothetical protein
MTFSPWSQLWHTLYLCEVLLWTFGSMSRRLCSEALLFSISVDGAFHSCLYWHSTKEKIRHSNGAWRHSFWLHVSHTDTHVGHSCYRRRVTATSLAWLKEECVSEIRIGFSLVLNLFIPHCLIGALEIVAFQGNYDRWVSVHEKNTVSACFNPLTPNDLQRRRAVSPLKI